MLRSSEPSRPFEFCGTDFPTASDLCPKCGGRQEVSWLKQPLLSDGDWRLEWLRRSEGRPVCGVCGFPELAAPQIGDREYTGSNEMCPCCGYHPSLEGDEDGITFAVYRQQWIAAGMQWWYRSKGPSPRWDPVEQMRAAGIAD